jgi:hypothetical protein
VKNEFFRIFFPTALYIYQRIMAPRRPLGEIDGNGPVGHELTVNYRAQIVDTMKCGASPCNVSKTLDSTAVKYERCLILLKL